MGNIARQWDIIQCQKENYQVMKRQEILNANYNVKEVRLKAKSSTPHSGKGNDRHRKTVSGGHLLQGRFDYVLLLWGGLRK